MKVKWLTPAEDDLREIARRLALTFGRDTTEQTVASVVEETRRLADVPDIGRFCNEYENAHRQYWVLHTRHDRIVYTVTDDCVLIVAVFDTRRDLATLSALLRERDSQSM